MSARVAPTNGAFSIPGIPVSEGINRLAVEVRDVSGNTATQTVEFTKGTLDPSERLEYDLNGNMTNWIQAGVTNTFSYDPENRLVKVESNGTTVLECWYDYAGRRIAKKETIDGVTNSVQYVYDEWTIVAVLNGQGQLLEYYTRGVGIAGDIGTIVAETKFTNGYSMATYYYHHNHRGDITLVRSNASTIAVYDYAPFGQIRTSLSSYKSRFMFSSKEKDTVSGLYYYGCRMYSPTLCRWLTPDAIGEMGGLNLYRFVSNNPLRYVDPLGLEPCASEKKAMEEAELKGWRLATQYGAANNAIDISRSRCNPFEPNPIAPPPTYDWILKQSGTSNFCDAIKWWKNKASQIAKEIESLPSHRKLKKKLE